jgi:diguanylate cyclase (GGDEF)-like protein
MTQITGYTDTELQGENPRKLGSGLQDADFYQIFWRHLNSNGHWSGALFNRRKGAQIFFAWTTIKAVRNALNDTVFYLAAYDERSPRENDYQQLPQLAYHHPLTGLPNRRLLEHRLAMAMADPSCKKTGMFVLLLELGHLKACREKIGPDLAGQLLCEVSERLAFAVRRADTVAQLEGGVFVILLPGVIDRNDAQSVVNFITTNLNAKFFDGKVPLDLGLRFGGASFPRNGDDMTAVFRHAEAALHNAKHLGVRLSFDAEQL